jgi:hypothetical protein
VNWDAVGAIGEVLGAIAVFATLVYLAIQIRQNNKLLAENTKMARIAAMEASMESGNRSRELIVSSPDLAAILVRGRESYAALDPIEKARFGGFLRNNFSAANVGYARHLALDYDPSDYEGSKRTIESALRQPGIREWYEETDFDWYPEFQALVQSLIKKIESESAG